MAEAASVVSEYDAWPLAADIRAKMVERISSNLAAMSFFSEKATRIDSTEAGKHASEIETAAFAEAESQAKGEALNPSQLIRLYAKHASGLMLTRIMGAPPSADVDMKEAPAGTKEEGKTLDISGGEREFLSKKRAEELLQPLLTSGEGYTKVCLSSKSFGREAAAVAARALANVKASLTDADLSDIIAGQKEDDALAALAEICGALEGSQLAGLDLSDNALGEKGVRACAAALKGQVSLQRLSFCNNGISEGAARAIRDLLPSAAQLRSLHFHNNMSGDEGAKALAQVVSEAGGLESFRFSSTRVGIEGGVALAQALATGSSLTALDLRDNMFGEEGGAALADALANHSALRDLCLSDTGVGDEGATALAGALEKNAPNLQVLELGGNDISRAAAPVLAQLLAARPGLRKVHLGENELGDKGAVTLVGAVTVNHSVLEELDLSSNGLSKVGAVAAAKAVASLGQFKILNLNGNAISEEGIEEVKKVLAKGVAGVKVLGPLDENDEEGGEDEEDDEEGEEDDELDTKLKSLEV